MNPPLSSEVTTGRRLPELPRTALGNFAGSRVGSLPPHPASSSIGQPRLLSDEVARQFGDMLGLSGNRRSLLLSSSLKLKSGGTLALTQIVRKFAKKFPFY